MPKQTQRCSAQEVLAEKENQELEYMRETASVAHTKGRYSIHCLTVVGQIEGHVSAPDNQKTTRYEQVIPQIVDIEEDPAIDGLMVVLNGGHSIGIPLAVSARRSFIVPTATMMVHPVRHSGTVLGVPQTMRYFDQMQDRITSFVTGHSNITARRFTQLMMHTGELVMDMGTVLTGEKAVREGLIDELGGIADVLQYLYKEIQAER